jgi:O-antigen/teichoic acid export membrane protein
LRQKIETNQPGLELLSEAWSQHEQDGHDFALPRHIALTTPFGHTVPQTRLRDRILRAGSWTLVGYGIELSVRLLSNLILTRLLFPEAFGAVYAAMALISGLTLISDFGAHVVVMQSPRGEQVAFLRSAWVFQLSRGFALWLILVSLCGVISVPALRMLLPTASVFALRSFPLITACLGFGLVLEGAVSMCVPLNARRLNYRPVVMIDLASRILSLPVMLIWAWLAPSVWALVAGNLGTSLVRLILSHVWLPGPRMGMNWEKDHFEEITRTGRWIAVSSSATFIGQSDLLFFGFLMPASELGLYSIAKLLVGLGEGFLERLTGALALPVFGEVIRTNPVDLRDHYYRFRVPIELAACLFSGGLFVTGHFVAGFLYDPRYEQAGFMLQILALGLLIYPILIIKYAFTATGDTHITALISVSQALSLIGCLILGYFAFGIVGAIVGVALHRIIPAIVLVFQARRKHWVAIWRELRVIPIFVIGLLLGKAFLLLAATLGVVNIHQLLPSHLFDRG